MIPVPNTFSLHDLAGFLAAGGVAGWMYVRYFRRGGRTTDLLLANMLACGALHCLLTFMQDNVVPQGRLSRAVPGASVETLLLFRLAYVVGVLAFFTQLHFVLRLCRGKRLQTRHVVWLYVVSLPLIAGACSEEVVRQRLEPIAEISGWTCAVPYMPLVGPAAVAYLGVWAGAQVYSQALLWQHHRRPGVDRAEATRIGLVRLGIMAPTSGVAIDLLNSCLDFPGVAVSPIAMILGAVLLAMSLRRDSTQADPGGAAILPAPGAARFPGRREGN